MTPDDEPLESTGSDDSFEVGLPAENAGPGPSFGDFAVPQPPEAALPAEQPDTALPAGVAQADVASAVVVPSEELVSGEPPVPSQQESSRAAGEGAPPHPIPGGKGRLIDVGFRPRGQIQVLPVRPSLPIEEQQPGLELPAEIRDLVHRPGQEPPLGPEKLPHRPQDPRVFPPAVKLPRAAAREPTQEQLKAVPRLVVMVSLANARALFDDAVQRAADKMAPRFQNLAKFEIDQYAFHRKSAERAVNPWMRGPMF